MYWCVFGTIIVVMFNIVDFLKLYKGRKIFPFSGYRLNAVFITFLYAECVPMMLSLAKDVYFIITLLFYIAYLVIYFSIYRRIQNKVGCQKVKKTLSREIQGLYIVLIVALLITIIVPSGSNIDRRTLYFLVGGFMSLIYFAILKIKKIRTM